MTKLNVHWLSSQPVRWLVEALGAENIYFVGGAVRNALLGSGAATDLDVATPLVPDVVTQRLQAIDISTIPTGLDHGTVTAVIAGQPIEITTFRKDVATDGRRAVTAFTTDLKTDAQRRDFTMNAIYMQSDGQIIDPVSGIHDLRQGRVRFIGDAETRLREDYLRAYRYFRFQAIFDAKQSDPEVLSVISRFRVGLYTLSAERVRVEFLKILKAQPDRLLVILADMLAAGANPAGLLSDASIKALGLVAHNRPLATDADTIPLLRLGMLAKAIRLSPEALQTALKLSKRETALIRAVAHAPERLGETALFNQAYFMGLEHAAAQLDICHTIQGSRADLVSALSRWQKPVCPVSASDLMALGFQPGPDLGRTLKKLEKAWAQSGFVLSRTDLLSEVGDD